MRESLLKVSDLSLRHKASDRCLFSHANFALQPLDTLGVLGASGAGKSTLARALMGMLDLSRWQVSGSIRINRSEVVGGSEKEHRKLRGKYVTLVRQEPELALNPVRPVGWQINEVLRAHFRTSRDVRREEARQALESVGLSAKRFYAAHLHELSGGERQRVVLALALAAKPALLILDEPTSAVDTVTQAELLHLLTQVRESVGFALIFITHNPALLKKLSSRVVEIRDEKVREL